MRIVFKIEYQNLKIQLSEFVCGIVIMPTKEKVMCYWEKNMSNATIWTLEYKMVERWIFEGVIFWSFQAILSLAIFGVRCYISMLANRTAEAKTIW